MYQPKQEITYIMVKPDGVKRGLTGEIISRLEQRGLKVVSLKMIQPTKKQVDDHYPKDETWISRIGDKTMSTHKKYNLPMGEDMQGKSTLEIGSIVRGWLIEYMISAPLVCMVVQGTHAVDMVRKLVGDTMPANALPGTIRGDYSVDSAALANEERRSVYNLIHASETQSEAQHEIKHWFGGIDLFDYERTDDAV